MRLTPAQIAVYQICGHNVPMGPDSSLEKCIKEGHDYLVSITKVDHGYDLQRWHDHLKESKKGGYTWNRSIDLPNIM